MQSPKNNFSHDFRLLQSKSAQACSYAFGQQLGLSAPPQTCPPPPPKPLQESAYLEVGWRYAHHTASLCSGVNDHTHNHAWGQDCAGPECALHTEWLLLLLCPLDRRGREGGRGGGDDTDYLLIIKHVIAHTDEVTRRRGALRGEHWEGSTERGALRGEHWEGSTERGALRGEHWEGSTERGALRGEHWEGSTERGALRGEHWEGSTERGAHAPKCCPHTYTGLHTESINNWCHIMYRPYTTCTHSTPHTQIYTGRHQQEPHAANMSALCLCRGDITHQELTDLLEAIIELTHSHPSRHTHITLGSVHAYTGKC